MQTPPLSTNPETPLTPPVPCCSPRIPACRHAGKLLCLSVGLVVLAIVATVSFLLGKYSASPRVRQPFNMRGVPLATPTENPTANWKTYTNEAYGFQIKYPPEANMIFNKDQTGKSEKIPTFYNAKYENSPGMRFFVLENPTKMEIKEFVADKFQKDKKASEEQKQPPPQELKNGKYITINGLKGFQGTQFGFDSEKLVAYLANEDYVIGIIFDDSNPNFDFTPENKKLFLQILYTFKFTNQNKTDETANWKTYSNSSAGFELKYPKTWTTKPFSISTTYPLHAVVELVSDIKPDPNKMSWPSIQIQYWENPSNLTLQQLEEKYTSSESGLGPKIYQPGGEWAQGDMDVYRVRNGDCEPYNCDKVTIVYNQKVIVIQNYLVIPENTFDQILSTFRFLD